MSGSASESSKTLTDVTGTQTMYVSAGLRIHQITISSAVGAGSSGSATVKLKMEGSPTFIPLADSSDAPVTFTYGAGGTKTGKTVPTNPCSIEAIEITGSGTYCVGYAAFDQ